MFNARNAVTLLLILAAVALLYPGVTQPALTVTGTIEKSMLVEVGIDLLAEEGEQSQSRQLLTMFSGFLGLDQVEGELEVYQSTRSIWGTAEGLAGNGYLGVAILVVLFSVLLPTFKLLLQATSLFVRSEELLGFLLGINAALSKWSMADVFLMGLLIAYMAGGATEQADEMLVMHASLGPGFYFFLGYCLFSIVAGKLMLDGRRPAPQ